jgi:hypothetical protein
MNTADFAHGARTATGVFAFRFLIAFIASLSSTAPAFADGEIDLPVQTCTTKNCRAVVVPARINSMPGRSNPWIGQFAGKTGHCLRFEVVTQSRDLAMTIVDPRGTIYTNGGAGSGHCPTCPVVVVGRIGLPGYFTAVVNNQVLAAVDAVFYLRVGQYAAGNPNCRPATIGNPR